MRTTHTVGRTIVTVRSRACEATTPNGGYPAAPARIVTCGRPRSARTVTGVLTSLQRRGIDVPAGLAVEVDGELAAAANEAMLVDWLAEHLERAAREEDGR